MVGWTSNSLVG